MVRPCFHQVAPLWCSHTAHWPLVNRYNMHPTLFIHWVLLPFTYMFTAVFRWRVLYPVSLQASHPLTDVLMRVSEWLGNDHVTPAKVGPSAKYSHMLGKSSWVFKPYLHSYFFASHAEVLSQHNIRGVDGRNHGRTRTLDTQRVFSMVKPELVPQWCVFKSEEDMKNWQGICSSYHKHSQMWKITTFCTCTQVTLKWHCSTVFWHFTASDCYCLLLQHVASQKWHTAVTWYHTAICHFCFYLINWLFILQIYRKSQSCSTSDMVSWSLYAIPLRWN